MPDDAPPLDRARLLHAVASTALLTDSKLDVLALTSEAVRLVPAQPPTALRAQVLTVHARANADRARDDDAARWAGEALAIARDLGLSDLAVDAATTLARLDERTGDPEASQAALVQTIADARAAGEVAAELRSLYNLAGLHYELGRLPQALEVFRQTWRRAIEAGRPWAPYGFDARALTAIVAHVSGDWQLAAETVDITGESAPALAEALLGAISLEVAAGRGDVRMLELMPWLRSWWDMDGMIAIISGGAAIDLLGHQGDLAAAQAIHDDVVANVGALWQEPMFQARIRLGALLLGHLASGAGLAGAEREGLTCRGDELVAATQQVAAQGMVRGRRRGPESDAWLARATAEHARLRWLAGVDLPGEDELVEVWRQAVSAFERFGHVHETARSRARLAAVLRATGHASDAVNEAALARAVAVHLGAEPLRAELRSLDPSGPAAGTSASRHDEPLTAREEEVLALVAEGRSNREIAGQLFISAKTVSVHVSNIMAKLGAGGRTEAVAVARRRGLLTDADT